MPSGPARRSPTWSRRRLCSRRRFQCPGFHFQRGRPAGRSEYQQQLSRRSAPLFCGRRSSLVRCWRHLDFRERSAAQWRASIPGKRLGCKFLLAEQRQHPHDQFGGHFPDQRRGLSDSPGFIGQAHLWRPGGRAAAPRSGQFMFSNNATNGGTVVATLQLQDGATNLGTVSFTFVMPVVSTFWNHQVISIPATNYVATNEAMRPGRPVSLQQPGFRHQHLCLGCGPHRVELGAHLSA